MGKNAIERLKDGGITISKSGPGIVDLADLHVLEPGHRLHDQRSTWPLDPVFKQSLVDAPSNHVVDVTAREAGIVKGKTDLEVIDGTRRTLHGLAANAERAKIGKPPIRGVLHLVEGSDGDMIVLRLRLNGGNRKAETPSSLAHKLQQGEGFDVPLAVMAREAGIPATVARDLLRWGNVVVPVRAMFDRGELPIASVGAFLDVPQPEQLALATEMFGKGPTQIKRAAREKNGVPAKSRPLSPKKVERVREALSAEGSTYYQMLAAFIAFERGDVNALRAWPALRTVVDQALAAPVKPASESAPAGLRADILTLLAKHPTFRFRVDEIAKEVGGEVQTVRGILSRMKAANEANNPERGHYKHAEKEI